MKKGDAWWEVILRNGLVLLILASLAAAVYGEPVDPARAALGARGWYELRFREVQKPEFSEARLTAVFTEEGARLIIARDMLIAYAFDVPDGGCIAISADDEQSPVFYYSFRSRLTFPGCPPAEEIMESFADKLAQLQHERCFRTRAEHPLWGSLVELAGVNRVVSPLAAFLSGPKGPLVKTTWDQVEPYNNQCPMYGGQRCLTGCVATAMAQIMRYWQLPTTGTDRHCYYWAAGRTSLCADYGSTTYDWANMPEHLTLGSPQKAKDAVGTLCYHCGVAVDMDYGPYASSAWHFRAAVALTKYFGYEPAQFVGQTGGMDLQVWYDMMCEQIDKGQPVMYGTKSHEFVMDGYDSPNLVHFNMGWGGEEDGWYAIDHFPLDSAMVDALAEIRPPQKLSAEITKALGGKIKLSWLSRPGDAYTVQSCFDLRIKIWNKEADVSSQGVLTSWQDATLTRRTKFYRVGRL